MKQSIQSKSTLLWKAKIPGPPQDWSDDETNTSGKSDNTPGESSSDTDSDLPDPATKLH